MTQLLMTILPCGRSELCRRAQHVQKLVLCQRQQMQHQIQTFRHSRHYTLPSFHHKPSLSPTPKQRHEQYHHTFLKQHKLLTHHTCLHFHTNTATDKQKGELTFENILCEANRRRVSEQLDTVKPVRKAEMLGLNTKAKSPKKMKMSAVLVPLCVVDGEPSLLFTLRSSSLRKHRGEVSFPGGNQDESDPDHVHTALRETFEEVGLNPRYFDVWGTMIPSPNRHKAGYMTYPVLAQYTKELDPNALTINREEVEEVFTCSIRDLCEGGRIKAGSTQFRTGNGYTLPVYVGGPHRIWGLSAIILHQTLTLLAPGLYTYKVRHVA